MHSRHLADITAAIHRRFPATQAAVIRFDHELTAETEEGEGGGLWVFFEVGGAAPAESLAGAAFARHAAPGSPCTVDLFVKRAE